MKRQRGLATLLAAFGVAALIALVHSFHTREAAAKGGGGTLKPFGRFVLYVHLVHAREGALRACWNARYVAPLCIGGATPELALLLNGNPAIVAS